MLTPVRSWERGETSNAILTGSARLAVPLRPGAGGVCTVRFDVAHTAFPGKSDPRVLGAHFLSFTYRR